MRFLKSSIRANLGYARILETIVAAAIIFIVFSVSSFLVNSSQINAVQERTDLDRLGYNVLSRLTESGVIEATIEKTPSLTIQFKAYLQNSLPSSIFFNLIIKTRSPGQEGWESLPAVNNTDPSSFSNSLEVSSTPMIYTSKSGKTYSLILNLAKAGGGS